MVITAQKDRKSGSEKAQQLANLDSWPVNERGMSQVSYQSD